MPLDALRAGDTTPRLLGTMRLIPKFGKLDLLG